MRSPRINARAESGVLPNKQLLTHSKVMAVNHVLALQKLATAGDSLGPVTLQGVEDFSAQPDQAADQGRTAT